MELKLPDKISYERVPQSRALRKFTDRQIKRWIQNKLNDYSIITHYEVQYRREGSGHEVNCHVKIHHGRKIWEAQKYAPDLHQALIHCLNRLEPVF
jgi:ribosome-associated translation inhibitor RaiA